MDTETETKNPRRDGALSILLSLVVFAGTWFQYEDLVAFEAGARESVRLNVVISLVYQTLGIVGVVAIMLLFGVGFLGYGLKLLIAPPQKAD